MNEKDNSDDEREEDDVFTNGNKPWKDEGYVF
jgi:hypothetical protein